MTLEDLIRQNALEEFKVSVELVKKRFAKGRGYLDFARKNLNSGSLNDNERSAVYDNIYDGIRLIAESFVYLNGYRTRGEHHHSMILQAMGRILDKENRLDAKIKNILIRLDKMRKRRNTVDYDINSPDITEQGIGDALKTADEFASMVEVFIKEKEGGSLI